MAATTSNTEPIQLVSGSLDDMAAHVMAAHVMAARISAAYMDEEFLTYLLDMVLVEIANSAVNHADW